MPHTLTVSFTPVSPAPTYGYTLKYREVGSSSWTYSYGHTVSPIVIPGLSGEAYEGSLMSQCDVAVFSNGVDWSVEAPSCFGYYLKTLGTTLGWTDCATAEEHLINVQPNEYFTLCSRTVPVGEYELISNQGPCS